MGDWDIFLWICCISRLLTCSVIATLWVNDVEPDTSLVLTGSCGNCVAVEHQKGQSIASLIRNDRAWSECRANLAVGEEDTPDSPALRRCDANLQLSSNMGLLSESAFKVYANQAPSLKTETIFNTELSEGSLESLSDLRVAEMFTDDADVSSYNYFWRKVEIVSCKNSPTQPCLWKLSAEQSDNCTADRTSCVFESAENWFTVELAAPLDYEEIPFHQIEIRATDAPYMPRIQQNDVTIFLNLRVVDVQDTGPQFVSFPTVVSVDELAPKFEYRDPTLNRQRAHSWQNYCEEHFVATCIGNKTFMQSSSQLNVLNFGRLKRRISGHVLFSVKAIDGDRGPNPSTIMYKLCQISGNACARAEDLYVALQDDDSVDTAIIIVKRPFTVEDFPDGYFSVAITAIENENGSNDTKTFRISVNDIDNHAAEFYMNNEEQETVAHFVDGSIDENAVAGTSIEFAAEVQLFVLDADRGANAQFSLRLEPDSTFQITPQRVQDSAFLTVRVKDITELDAESKTYINVTVISNGSLSGEERRVVIRVYIRDVNDEVSIITECEEGGSFNISINETVFSGTPFLLRTWRALDDLSDLDRDEENRNVTQFRSSSFDQPKFGISSSGTLSVVGKLDYERVQQHEINTEVDNIGRNGMMMRSVCSIKIHVTDVNDEPPSFTADSWQTEPYQIFENAVTSVATVFAQDLDASAKLKFRFRVDQFDGASHVSLDGLQSHFQFATLEPVDGGKIWTGELFVVKGLDREEVTAISASILVTDLNAEADIPQQTIEHRVKITVLDVNDHAPRLYYNNDEVGAETSIEVDEGMRNLAFTFVVEDVDTVPNPSNFVPRLYSDAAELASNVVIGNSASRSDRIILTIAEAFTYTKGSDTNQVHFRLVVFDDTPGAGREVNNKTVRITLDIRDRNNHNPVIVSPLQNQQFSFDESDTAQVTETFAKVLLFDVAAVDEDSDEVTLPFDFRLSLSKAPLLEDKLEIDEKTGRVYVKTAIDREVPGFDRPFELSLQVRDNANQPFDQRWSETVSVILSINDINDHEPVFGEDTQDTVTLLPNQNNIDGRLGFRLHVTDKDDPAKCGYLVYRLLGEDVPARINSLTGEITLTSVLPESHEFKLEVWDGLKDGCGIGHRITRSLIVKLLGQELLYELVVEMEVDDRLLTEAAQRELERTLSLIAEAAGLKYVYYSLGPVNRGRTPTSRAKSLQTIQFAFLDPATNEPVERDRITALLNNNRQILRDVGVQGDSVRVTSEPQKQGTEMIVIIVLAILLGLLSIVTIVFISETRKQKRKLHAYKASEDLSVMKNGIHEMSPYYAATGPKSNPIFAKFDDEYGRSFVEEDVGEKGDMPDNVSHISSEIKSIRSLENKNFEEMLAGRNREALQAQLRTARGL